MSMYIVWPSVLSVINLKIHKTKAIKLLYLVLFPLYQSLFSELREKIYNLQF